MTISLPITYKTLPELPEYTRVEVVGAGPARNNSTVNPPVDNNLLKQNSSPQMSNFDMGIAGLQTLGNLMGAWNGYQQNKLAKQQFAFQQDAFNKQYAAQRGLTNSQLEDRQRRRVSEAEANGYTGTMSVAEYMDKYGVK